MCAALAGGSLVASCSTPNQDNPVSGKYGSAITHAGEGEFTFSGYQPLADQPVKVWYLAPPRDVAQAEILIVIPGTGRDAEEYRADWVTQVRDRNVLLLVPEFSEDDFPGVSSYNLGNMVDEAGDPVPQAEWSFQLVEALFDHVVRDVGSQARTYAMFGHSAGAQFVHRFVEFMPSNRARVAIAANAGWYTMLDDAVRFPYGTKGSPLSEREMGPALRSNLIVLLGADDNDSSASNLRRDEDADAQGVNRLDRGVAFYQRARDAAKDHSLPFQWYLVVVPGVAHSRTDMAKVAAPLIFGGALRTS
jgi:hypothetical protein